MGAAQIHLADGDLRSPAAIRSILTRPFGRELVRFKKGQGEWYPYFESDDLQDRLIEATGNCYDLDIDNWEWRDRTVIVYGHLTIPGLGRRAGIGVQQHTSSAGNAMGEDMLKGMLADLLKNCLVRFDCGTQVRRMDPLKVDPKDRRNAGEVARYLDRYFPLAEVTSPPGPLSSREGFTSPPGPFSSREGFTSPPNPLSSREGEQEGQTVDMKCELCPTVLRPAQVTLSQHKFQRTLCPSCQKANQA